jgi:hypothetical protein
MIKRIIGGLFAVAVIAVITFTAIGVGSYKSMLPEDLFQREVEPAVEVVEPVAEEPAEEVEMQDSVEMENAPESVEVAEDAEPAEPAESTEQE